MRVVMYTDLLRDIGYITEEEWDTWTYEYGNLVDIDIPKDILESWFNKFLKEKYKGISFWKWYSEESIADDMDGFFEFTEWRPFLFDIKNWGAGESHYMDLNLIYER